MKIFSRFNSIAARIAVAIILAIVLGFLTTTGVIMVASPLRQNQDDGSRQHLYASRSSFLVMNPQHNPQMLSGRMVAIVRAVASTPASERPKIVAAMSQPDLQVALDQAPTTGAVDNADGDIDLLRRFVEMQLETFSKSIRVGAHPLAVLDGGRRGQSSWSHRIAVDADLEDGQRITFTIPDFLTGAALGLPIFLGSIIFVAIVVSILTAHRLAAPIRDFAAAADRLGVDLTAPQLIERGPTELRATIKTVNRMQQRLQRFVEDRTQMLAAISHDLRSPLARLRLRIELVANREQQRKMFGDLEAMNAMIDSTLAFARDEARQEPRRLVDLGILVGDVCEDAGDVGGKVSYAGGRGIELSCRPTMVRRAVANLVDNAVKYGGGARVNILRDTDRVAVVVDDDGPGIPPEEQEKVFAPFYRRDPARDPAKAGVGLGLSIARTVAREHGGDVTLRNREAGGLSALIELPA